MAFFIAMDNAQDNPSPIIIPALDDDRLRRITHRNFFLYRQHRGRLGIIRNNAS
jgi:hypothetical protein